MGLVLEDDDFAGEYTVGRSIFGEEVGQAVGMEGSVRAQTPDPLLLYDEVIERQQLLRRYVLLLELDYIADHGATGLGLLSDGVSLYRRLLVDAVDLHPQLGNGREAEFLV